MRTCAPLPFLCRLLALPAWAGAHFICLEAPTELSSPQLSEHRFAYFKYYQPHRGACEQNAMGGRRGSMRSGGGRQLNGARVDQGRAIRHVQMTHNSALLVLRP